MVTVHFACLDLNCCPREDQTRLARSLGYPCERQRPVPRFDSREVPIFRSRWKANFML